MNEKPLPPELLKLLGLDESPGDEASALAVADALRLIKAYMLITDHELRSALVVLFERIARSIKS